MPKSVKTQVSLAEQRKRAVFRSVLDNPLAGVLWPEVDIEIGDVAVDLLCTLLAEMHNTAASQHNIKRSERKKNHKISNLRADNIPIKSEQEKPCSGDMLSSFAFGLNPTTKALEAQSLSATANRKASGNKRFNPVVAVFVARADLSPPVLASHLPVLCLQSTTVVKLVQLPKHSMKLLETASGIKNLGIVGLRQGLDKAQTLLDVIDSKVDPVSAQWDVCNMRIKHVKTSVPHAPNAKTRTPL